MIRPMGCRCRARVRRIGAISHATRLRFARECEGQADLIALLAYAELRWDDMAALKASSIDFTRRRADVREPLTDVARHSGSGMPETHERRSVPSPAYLEAPLR